MKNQCGICEYKGDFASAPSSLCDNCADAIQRLLWIREREAMAAEAPLALARRQAPAEQIAAAPFEY